MQAEQHVMSVHQLLLVFTCCTTHALLISTGTTGLWQAMSRNCRRGATWMCHMTMCLIKRHKPINYICLTQVNFCQSAVSTAASVALLHITAVPITGHINEPRSFSGNSRTVNDEFYHSFACTSCLSCYEVVSWEISASQLWHPIQCSLKCHPSYKCVLL